MVMTLNEEFQTLMDILIIKNGVPNKVPHIETISTEFLQQIMNVIETEIVSRDINFRERTLTKDQEFNSRCENGNWEL